MRDTLEILIALAELARLSLKKKKPQRCYNSVLGRVGYSQVSRKHNVMKLRSERKKSNLHRDLPLFRFAVVRADNRRLSYAERYTQRRAPGRPPSTIRLMASLAGFKAED